MPAPKGHKPYAGCETGGRPELYTDEVIEKFADELLQWIRYPNNIFFEEFTIQKGILPEYMTRWASRNEKFNQAYKLAKNNQELQLKKGASFKVLSEGFTKFLLLNNHGTQKYSDKTEHKVTGDVENPLSFALTKAVDKSKDLVDDEK